MSQILAELGVDEMRQHLLRTTLMVAAVFHKTFVLAPNHGIARCGRRVHFATFTWRVRHGTRMSGSRDRHLPIWGVMWHGLTHAHSPAAFRANSIVFTRSGVVVCTPKSVVSTPFSFKLELAKTKYPVVLDGLEMFL